MVYEHSCTDVRSHSSHTDHTVNDCEHDPVCTVAISERIGHAGGTIGDLGTRPGRIPATARAHNPARDPQQPRGPTWRPARACAVREGGPITVATAAMTSERLRMGGKQAQI